MHSCMKKIGEGGRNNGGNSFNNGYGYNNRNDGDANNKDEYSDEDENSNSRYDENNGQNRHNNNNYRNQGSRYRRKANNANKMHAQQNSNDWQQFQDQSFANNNNNSGRQNQSNLDKSCIVQCFFQEMKLVTLIRVESRPHNIVFYFFSRPVAMVCQIVIKFYIL